MFAEMVEMMLIHGDLKILGVNLLFVLIEAKLIDSNIFYKQNSLS